MPEQSSPGSELTPEERLRQLAAILARGVRRYRILARRYESDASDEPGETRPAVYHNLWDFWARVLATSVATGHYHAETTAGMLIIVGDMVSEP